MRTHKLVDDTLVRDVNGITARCECGWVSSGHISGMGASVAFMNHQEEVERIIKFAVTEGGKDDAR